MELIQHVTIQQVKIFSLLGTFLGAMSAIPAKAQPQLLEKSSDSSIQVAQLFYPSSSEQAAIKVLGQGQVSLPADVAKLEFQVSGSSAPEIPATPDAEAETPDEETETPETESPESVMPSAPTLVLSTEDVQPIVNALRAAGVSQSAIEVTIQQGSSSSFPFPFPGSDPGAKISVRVTNPSRDRLQQIVKAANSAASKSETLSIDKVNVQYITLDCGKIAQAAYTAAVQDAQRRATAIATAMGVRLSGAPSVAESTFYDLFIPLCTENSELPSFLPFGNLSSTYNPETPPQVQLRRDLFMSFPIQSRE